jgi:hypothetical protein
MEYIWAIYMIAGGGYDQDVIGFFDTGISARNAVEEVLRSKGLRWTNYVYTDRIKMIIDDRTEWYEIKRMPKNQIV